MKVYADYAAYYDLLYLDKDYQKEARFVGGILQRFAPGASNVLNLGCGTGVHDVALAGLGYQVHGLDISDDMIACAEKRKASLASELQRRVSFATGDARTFATDRIYDAVTSLFHVICYQTTDDDLRLMMATARRHLKSGGPFVFDFWHGPALADGPFAYREKAVENDAMKVHRIARSDWHPERHGVTVNYDVSILDKQSGQTQHLEEHHHLRYLFPAELESLLNKEGFRVAEWGEWLTGAVPAKESFGVYAVALAE